MTRPRRRRRRRSQDAQQLATELGNRAHGEGGGLVGPDGLLTEVTQRVLKTGLKGRDVGASRLRQAGPRGRDHAHNGTRARKVLTDIGPAEIDVPRIVTARSSRRRSAKRQRQLGGVDAMVISLCAKAPDHRRDRRAPGRKVYGADVSNETV
jgi:transposase-like protein